MLLKIIIGIVLGGFVAFEIYDLIKKIINHKNYKKQKSNTNQNEIDNKENEK